MKKRSALITTAEACRRLGDIDRSTLTRWVQLGKIEPAQKLPGARGAYLFDPADVEAVRESLAESGESISP